MPPQGAEAKNYIIFGHSLHSTLQASICLYEVMPSHGINYPDAPLFPLQFKIGLITYKIHNQGQPVYLRGLIHPYTSFIVLYCIVYLYSAQYLHILQDSKPYLTNRLHKYSPNSQVTDIPLTGR